MNQAKTAHAHGMRALRHRLLKRREQLEVEVKTHVASARTESAPEPGGEAVTQVTEQEAGLAEAQRDVDELRAIDAALARMDAGEYGLCSDCGATIPHARLEANPHALRCIACATAQENAHGAPRHPTL